jgi:hypothetical protein
VHRGYTKPVFSFHLDEDMQRTIRGRYVELYIGIARNHISKSYVKYRIICMTAKTNMLTLGNMSVHLTNLSHATVISVFVDR